MAARSNIGGTTSPTFQIDSDGPLLKNVSGTLEVRNDADSALVKVRALQATAAGDVVTLEDVGGSPGLPAVDGSQLTGVVATPASPDKGQVALSSSQTRSSNSYALLNGMTFTIGAGTYDFEFSSAANRDDNNEIARFALFVNTDGAGHVEEAATERRIEEGDADTQFGIEIAKRVVLSGTSHVVTIRWRISGGSTVSVDERIFKYLEIQ